MTVAVSPLFNPQNVPIKPVNVNSKCLDVPGGNINPYYPLTIWDCHGGMHQRWKYMNGALVNERNGLCLDITGAGTSSGTLVGQNQCNGGQNQEWGYNNDKTLTSPSAPGMCLDLKGEYFHTQIWDCNGGIYQQWTL